jgi:hypothetical protein
VLLRHVCLCRRFVFCRPFVLRQTIFTCKSCSSTASVHYGEYRAFPKSVGYHLVSTFLLVFLLKTISRSRIADGFSSLTQDDIPFKLRCAICNNLAINAFRLPCCDQAICESCMLSSSYFTRLHSINYHAQARHHCPKAAQSANTTPSPPTCASRIKLFVRR